MNRDSTSFYVTGGTLRQAGEPRFDAQRQRRGPGPGPSYVERQADRGLYEGLLRGEFCCVLTSRQMGKSSFFTTLGGALYRAGELTLAVERLADESAPTEEGEAVIRRLFLAMAEARRGRPAAARRWLTEASRRMGPALQRKPWEEPLSWDQRLILQQLCREAEALMGRGRASS